VTATEGSEWWSPRLRSVDRGYEEWRYATASAMYLCRPGGLPERPPFYAVVESRSSIPPTASLSELDLSSVLWFTSKSRSSAKPGEPRWEHRPAPSAGGRHPIDVLVSNWPPGSNKVYHYDPMAHALCALRPQRAGAVQELTSAAEKTTGSRNGVILWHAAQFDRTLSKYEEGETLVWRDAGVLVGMTALVAEALTLACCPIGLTGEPVLSNVLGSGGRVRGVGGCIVGRGPDESMVRR
jgi:SagB-type dehydrogenase family enzyme